MRRSRVETAIHIVLKGNPEETEKQIQKIHNSLVEKNSTSPLEPTPEIIADAKPEEVKNTDAYSNPFEPFYNPGN
jgi:hypothetical protein